MTELIKTFEGAVVLKDGADDSALPKIVARIGTIGEPDLMGDIIVKDAIGRQSIVISDYGHNHMKLPIGKGVVFENADALMMEGELFTDTDAGKTAHTVLKHIGEGQGWSWAGSVTKRRERDDDDNGFRLEQIKMREASPVLSPAGIGTQTIDIAKSQETASQREITRKTHIRYLDIARV